MPRGRVYLTLDDCALVPASEEIHPTWGGLRDFGSDVPPERGPSFADASDAVKWWRQRGAEWIVIQIDSSEDLWAGVGPPPLAGAADERMAVFSDDDPRGRPEGAFATAEAARKRFETLFAHHQEQRWIEQGDQLRRRREAVGVSLEDLASRIGVDPSWVEDVELGRTTMEVTLGEWVELVWATREPWPDNRRMEETHRSSSRSWMAPNLLAAAEDQVSECLALNDETANS